MTPQQTALTDKLANKLYDWSGGIPAYIIKIFQETQAQVLLRGESTISERTMQRAIDILTLRVPKTYTGGTSLSDFEVEVEPGGWETGEQQAKDGQDVPRQYANKRGRKAAQRDREDLLAAYRNGRDILHHLTEFGLLERPEKKC